MSEYKINFPYTTSTVTSVTGSTADALIFDTDANRGKVILMHSGSSQAYVLFGTGSASSTNATFVLTNGLSVSDVDWKGPVHATFVSQSSTTRIFATSIQK